MKISGSSKNLPGHVLYKSPPITVKEMDEAIGDVLALDDLRTMGPKRLQPVPGETEALPSRAYEEWDAGNHRSAFRLMHAAAKRGGDSRAMLNLGYFYDVGIGVRKNRSAAMSWYKRAYRLGDECAANNIGTVYRSEGKPRRALYRFAKAVELGEIDSNLEKARVYLEDLNAPEAAAPYLHRVLKAKPRIEVTESSREEAILLLKDLQGPPRRNKRRP
jgi:hypothetical protein